MDIDSISGDIAIAAANQRGGALAAATGEDDTRSSSTAGRSARMREAPIERSEAAQNGEIYDRDREVEQSQ